MYPNGQITFNDPPRYTPRRRQAFSDAPSLTKQKKKEIRKNWQEGQDEATKETTKQKIQQREKFEQLVDQSGKIILNVKTVWPFDLFPNEITIDLNKVNIYFKEFFWSGQLRSVPIEKISSVFAETGLFFGTLKITSEDFIENAVDIKYLWREDAIHARRIIQGLMSVAKQRIDLTKISTHELPEKIAEIGRAGEVEKQDSLK
jgi:hypothetical protein